MSTAPGVVLLPDLRIGNMASVVNMVRKCGGAPEIVTAPRQLSDRARIILAGVGSFDAAMEAVLASGWAEPLTRLAMDQKVPVLGICLGMQIMSRGSEEGKLPGLGWVEADVKRLSFSPETRLKVPHMGWNTVEVARSNPLIDDAGGEQRFYFVHSYHVVCQNPSDVVAIARYGCDVTAAVNRANIFGVQFHPEKSHRFGMAVIQRFLALSCSSTA
jgi:imidazole glycerol-phosphate synthase subunit HisH